MRARHHASGGLLAGRGFTLIEAVLSTAVSAVLLLAMASLMFVASRAIPDRKSSGGSAHAAAAAMEQLTLDLSQATKIAEATDKAVIIEVPDRDGDLKEESLRYEWSGVSGSPLLYSVNGGTGQALVRPVTGFGLVFTVETGKELFASQRISVAETRVWDAPSLGVTLPQLVDSSMSVAQAVLPSLPAGTATWTVTRVRVYCSKLGTGGTTRVELRPTTAAGMPSDTIIASTTIPASSLSTSSAMVEASFGGAPALAPGQEVAIVLASHDGTTSMRVSYITLALLAEQSMWTYSSGAWLQNGLSVIPCEVYATLKRVDESAVQVDRTTRAEVKLELSGVPPMRSQVQIVNTPEVP